MNPRVGLPRSGVGARVGLPAMVAALSAGAMLVGMATWPGGAVAAGGAGGAYQTVLRVYERDGSVPACQFSGAELERALGGVDTYGAQYFADFTEAIQSALSAAASGACVRPSGGVTGGSGGPPARFGPVTAATSAGVPAPLLAMGVLGVAVALFSGVWQLDRRRSRT